MTLRIAWHEFRLLVTDRSLVRVLLTLSGLVGYGVFNGQRWVEGQERVLQNAALEEQRRYESLEEQLGSPGEGRALPADQVGSTLGARYARMPTAPLAALVIGQSDLHPSYATISTAPRAVFEAPEEIENPTHLLTGRFDLGFVVIALYPLVILAISYDALSSERERGTLVMVLSQPVRLRALVLGKTVTRALVVLGSGAILVLIGCLLGGLNPRSGEEIARLGLWLAVVVAYGLFWFALAIAINALGRSSATNALCLSGLWLVLVGIVPPISNLIAQVVYPLPSRIEVIQATRSASRDVEAEGSRLKARFFEDHPELAGAEADYDEYAVLALATQEAIENRVSGLAERYETQLRRRRRLTDRLRFASPAIAGWEALQDASGTGSKRYSHFQQQVESFEDQWDAFFRPRILERRPIKVEELKHIPTFQFEEESLGQVARRVSIGLLGILAPTSVLAGLARSSLSRFPIAS